MISDKALSKMLVVYTEQCRAVASFTERTVHENIWFCKPDQLSSLASRAKGKWVVA